MTTPLPAGTPVEILAHRFEGWTGKVKRRGCHDRMYWIALTHDPDGEWLLHDHLTGPYARKELKPLTDPLTGRPLCGPVIDATEGVAFSGGQD